MDFGRAILSIRKHLNKSQAELSANLGVDQSYLSQIENNKRSPSTKLLEQLSSITNIPLPIIFFYTMSESDVSEDKKELFRIIYPRIKDMISEIFIANDA